MEHTVLEINPDAFLEMVRAIGRAKTQHGRVPTEKITAAVAEIEKLCPKEDEPLATNIPVPYANAVRKFIGHKCNQSNPTDAHVFCNMRALAGRIKRVNQNLHSTELDKISIDCQSLYHRTLGARSESRAMA